VLPVPARSKRLEVVGYTGRDGQDPSGADVYEWREQRPSDNLALRLPDGKLGLDLDLYKPEGAATFAAALAKYGPLPPTWRSTARDDGSSGIYYFTVPTGRVWAGQLGDGCEVIQRSHRYALAPPSIHPLGWTYRWYDPASAVTITIPSPNAFPLLPEPWIEWLSRGEQREVARVDMDSGEAWEWLANLPGASEPTCQLMRGEMARTIVAINSGGSRHDALLPKIMEMMRLGTQGHRGVAKELEVVRRAFISAVTRKGDGQRTSAQASSEWRRAFDGGAELVRANTEELILRDPCRPPFSEELLEEGRRRRAIALETAVQAAQGHPSSTDDLSEDDGPLSSWDPDPTWADAMDGKLTGIVPVALRRQDGPLIWYPGRVNGLLGPSESGKSWVALLAVYQTVALGGTVVILDFEDDSAGVSERVRALGVSPALGKEQVVYIRPDEELTDERLARLLRVCREIKPVVIIVDGVNAAMTLMDLDLLDNKDATTFAQRLLRPLSETGAAVGYVDHTPKNDTEMSSKGGIGAQAKRAMTTGAAVRVEVVEPFDREHPGKLRLWVDKDRAGHVRRAAVGGLIGVIHAEPDGAGALRLRFEPPPANEIDDDGKPVDRDMARVAEALYMRGELNSRGIRSLSGVKGTKADTAIDKLIAGGFVELTVGKGNAHLHRLIKTYPDGRVPGVPRVPHSGTHVESGVSPLRGGHYDPHSTDGSIWPSVSTVDVELPDPADDPGAE
jgi:hypothetical protein